MFGQISMFDSQWVSRVPSANSILFLSDMRIEICFGRNYEDEGDYQIFIVISDREWSLMRVKCSLLLLVAYQTSTSSITSQSE
jgi:hypothetical protein